MTLAQKYGFAAAGVAAVMVAVPLSASAVETTATTGTVTITRFDDRYADGLFDPSKTAPSGDVDRKNTDLTVRLQGSDGSWFYGSANAAGDYRFENVPLGPAKVYLSYPNGPGGEVLFDATGAASAAEIERLPIAELFSAAHGLVELTVDDDGESRLIGMSALRLVANVQFADGAPAAGVAVELGSAADWYPATEYSFRAGTYEAFDGSNYVRHLPGALGLRVQAPEGYRVASVTAGDVNPFTVTERDGAYWFDSAQVLNFFWNPAFTVTLEELPDTVRPEVTLVSPATAGPFQSLSVRVDATDAGGLQRIVANIYRDGKLVKSTQTAIGGAETGSHTATVKLPDGEYTIKVNAQDLAGNISRTGTVPFTIDTKAPKATIKDGASFTVKDGSGYDLISFKLNDPGKIDRVTINGVVKDLTDNAWSDVNFVKPGTFGAVEGENTLVVFDVAGNTRTITFTLN